jgi:ATP-dependent phosphofructokinase / diphosphate-dependent phosphofructokinase
MATFGILCGGGPAPGLNGVIGAAAIAAHRRGARAIGLMDGFKWIMEGDTRHVRRLDPDDVRLIHLAGGSVIHTSRANPTRKPESLANCVKALRALGIDHLITVGGDDTAFSARRVAEEAAGAIRVAHVPKTIDNDLPLPEGIPTFGFDTARHLGASVVERIMEDCRTTSRWFIVVMMGRQSGHLALGTGKAAGAPLILIPEEFPEGPIEFERVLRLIEGAIVKRLARGRADGVAVVAEGLLERMPESSLSVLQDVVRDEHGHIRLGDIPFGRTLRTELVRVLGGRGVKVALGEKDVGYELRCGAPSGYDRDYTLDLGVGAVEALLAGRSSVLITRRDHAIVPIPFEELMDPATGKTRVRYVDTDTDHYRNGRALQERVEADDLEDPQRLAAIAAAAKLSPEEAKARYAPL